VEFRDLAARIQEQLTGTNAWGIDHVGSTSVPGLAAKDVLDLQVRVDDVADPRAPAAFARLGFRLRLEPWNETESYGGVAYRKRVFAPPAGDRLANVHVRLGEAPTTRAAVLFRDYLRNEDSARDDWLAFKIELASGKPNLVAYGQAKIPAWDVLMLTAERGGPEHGWSMPSPDVVL